MSSSAVSIIYLGMDVHKDSLTIAVLPVVATSAANACLTRWRSPAGAEGNRQVQRLVGRRAAHDLIGRLSAVNAPRRLALR